MTSSIWARQKSKGVEEESNSGYFVEAILLSIATIFVVSSGIALYIIDDRSSALQHLWAPLVWLVCIVVTFYLLHRFANYHDHLLFPVVSLLTGWGLILLDRLAPNFLSRQVLWLILGLIVMVIVAIFPKDLRIFQRYRYSLLIFGLLLLLATFFFGVNPSGAGAPLWLKIPFLGNVYFQPSELLKVILVIFLASFFDEHDLLSRLTITSRTTWQQLHFLLPLFVMWGFSLVILIWQRDLGTATLFFIVFLAMLYLATGSGKMVAAGIILLLAAGVLAYFVFDVVALRIDTWINPWPEATSRGYQIAQSLYALASGGVFGEGVGQGSPTYIPVVHSDFAFAAVGEEWGLIGGLTVVVLFAVMAYRGFRIAAISTRSFHLYLAAGFAIMFSVQSLLIMGGVTKVLPLTGVTLPLMSYGGSSMVISFLMVGLLLNLSRSNNKKTSHSE
jgi:cell division protein FtsW (lipid II flippase)